MVVIDSPGGTIAGTSDLADDIRNASATKPTYVYASDLMASAALWAGSGARQVFANKSAEIGSIGVYAVVYDTSGMAAKDNVKVHVISSAPPIKGAGVGGTEITPPQLAEWERQVKDLADLFVGELSRNRRMTREQAQSLATGQVWVAEQARERGLIDGVISLDEAMQRLLEEAMEENNSKAALAQAEEAKATAEKEKQAREEAEKKLEETQNKLKSLETEKNALEAEKRRNSFAAQTQELKLSAEFAATLDAIEGRCGPEVYDAVVTQLKALRAQIDESVLFGEKGKGAPEAGGSAYDQAVALARAKVTAGQAKTLAKALSLVWAERPDLWTQYEKERHRTVAS
jgi:signal peptide peptidase SppA